MRSKHSFIGAFDDHGPYGRGRYNENMAPEVNITSRRQGSQWFEVNRKLAVSMVEDTTYITQNLRNSVDRIVMLTIRAAPLLGGLVKGWGSPSYLRKS
ncbi:hypothetical protein OIU84_000407 [Salix udensis]|uniref:Uncharacterized protein n=1 Tax=Salix udensis TaxID=889485 RepID=A0AAD6L4L9_9ROSI|nr:hypothetical protein OIU84_000407 [Salix udensis]